MDKLTQSPCQRYSAPIAREGYVGNLLPRDIAFFNSLGIDKEAFNKSIAQETALIWGGMNEEEQINEHK